MELLLELLLELLFEVLGQLFTEASSELFRRGRRAPSLVLPDRPRPGRRPLATCLGALAAGGLLGAASAHLLPARVAPQAFGAMVTWVAVLLAGALTGLALELPRRQERRDPALAVVSGALFALAWLGGRTAARAAGP